jgi:hypothetical protein
MSKIVPYNTVQAFLQAVFQSSITKSAYIDFVTYFDPVISCLISQGLRSIQNLKLREFASKHKDAVASYIKVNDVRQYAQEHFLKKTSTLSYEQISSILEFIMAEVLETLDKKITNKTIKDKLTKHPDLQDIKRKASIRKSPVRKLSSKKGSVKKDSSKKGSSQKRSSQKRSGKKQ